MRCNAPTDPRTGLALDAPSVSSVDYIVHCQNEIGDEDAYCSVCGSKVVRQETSTPQKRARRLPIWVIVVAIAIFALQYVSRFVQAELRKQQVERIEQRQKMDQEMSELLNKVKERLQQQRSNWEK